MFTFTIVSLLMVAFVIGVAVGHGLNAADRLKLKDAQKEAADLHTELYAWKVDSDERFRWYEKRLSSADQVIQEYEEIFDDLEKQKEATLSAVILPFEQSRIVKGHFIDGEESNVIK
jgi:hypothetical protein